MNAPSRYRSRITGYTVRLHVCADPDRLGIEFMDGPHDGALGAIPVEAFERIFEAVS